MRFAKILSFVLMLGLFSCKNGEAPNGVGKLAKPSVYPEFRALYHPYGRAALERRFATPIPDYTSWTSERMERDMRRLGQAGFNRVEVVLTTRQANDAFKIRRFAAFSKVCGKQRGLKVCLRLVSEREELQRGTLSRNLLEAGILQSSANVLRGGRLLVLYERNCKFSGPPHPALAFEPVQAVSRVTSGQVGENGVLERKAQDTFRKNLLRAFAASVPVVEINWNDYAAGDFIEPNTRDEQRCLEVLQEEQAHLRKLLSPPAEAKD